MFSNVELKRRGRTLGFPKPSVENSVTCCAGIDIGVTCEDIKELGGTLGSLRDIEVLRSVLDFRCMMTPQGAAQADSTSNGIWTTWLVPERK